MTLTILIERREKVSQKTIADFDILTIAVLLPEEEGKREELFEQISNNADIYGSVALAAMHGNAINYVRSMDALHNNEDASSITQRLAEVNSLQIENAFRAMKSGKASTTHEQAKSKFDPNARQTLPFRAGKDSAASGSWPSQ